MNRADQEIERFVSMLDIANRELIEVSHTPTTAKRFA
jgi:hypothetical protein